MKLRSRFTALFAVLATATIVVLVLVSDAIVGRAAAERVAERFGRELEHLASDWSTAPPAGVPRRVPAGRRAAARLPGHLHRPERKGPRRFGPVAGGRPAMENHSNRPEVAKPRNRESAPRAAAHRPSKGPCSTSRAAFPTAACSVWPFRRPGCARWSSATSGPCASRSRRRASLLFLIGPRRPAASPADRRSHPERLGDRGGRLRPGPAPHGRRGGPDAVRGRPAHEGLPQHARSSGRKASAASRRWSSRRCPTASSSSMRSSACSSRTDASRS